MSTSDSALLDRLLDVQRPKRFDSREAEAFLNGFQWNNETMEYHRNNLSRYLSTMDWFSGMAIDTRVLEIGAAPYGMALLMKRYLFDSITLTGFAEKDVTKSQECYEETKIFDSPLDSLKYALQIHNFNVELHDWPFENRSFGLVIACEIFEHLALDPMHAISEANRVLTSGGKLFITVPNVLSISNVMRILRGIQPNSFPYYRPEGVCCRHNRELTPEELTTLFEAGGFEVDFVTTVNFEQPSLVDQSTLSVLPLISGPLDLRRNTIVIMGTKVAAVRDRYPRGAQLYYQWDIESLMRRNNIHCSDNSNTEESSSPRTSKTISVVTPSYNQGQFIEDTIKSVISQEGDFFIDYIIMDGGSKDNSVEVIKKYDQLLKDGKWPVRCKGIDYRWVSEKDGGHIDALEKGFAKAEGALGVWLNSDDIFYDSKVFTKVISEFANDASLQMLTGDGPFIEKNGREFGLHHVDQLNFKELIYLDYHILQPATFVRKAIYKNEHLDPAYGICFDAEYYIRLIAKGYKYRKVIDNFACFRLYPETRTLSGLGKRYRTSLKISRTYGKNSLFFLVSALYKYFEIVLQNKYPENTRIKKLLHSLRMFSYRIILGKRHRFRDDG